jgi:hypothetical protein
MTQLSRKEFFRLIGELARAKSMPCILNPTEQELIARRDGQKKRLERVAHERKLKRA